MYSTSTMKVCVMKTSSTMRLQYISSSWIAMTLINKAIPNTKRQLPSETWVRPLTILAATRVEDFCVWWSHFDQVLSLSCDMYAPNNICILYSIYKSKHIQSNVLEIQVIYYISSQFNWGIYRNTRHKIHLFVFEGAFYSHIEGQSVFKLVQMKVVYLFYLTA